MTATAAAVVAVVVSLGAAGCGGPLDTPDPRPRHDAGIDTGSGGHRATDAAPDLVRDARMLPDAAVDTGVDAQWPDVPGCVTGLPPSPQFEPQSIPPVTISCAASSIVIMHLSDANAQWMVYSATLNPPIDGVSVPFSGALCTGNTDSAIELSVNLSIALPGTIFSTALTVTLAGPPPQRTYGFRFDINTVPIDFTVDPAVIDFGTVIAGQGISMPLTVTNALDGAPLQNVYPSQSYQGPFQLFPIGGGPPLQPGDAEPMLEAVLSTQVPGTYDETFLVSAFPPGSVIDTRCGVIRTVTMHAQVITLLP